MPSEYVFDRMLFSQQAFNAWLQQNNWLRWRNGQPSFYICDEIPGLDPPCPARMKMRRLPGGRFEISLKYEHQHGRTFNPSNPSLDDNDDLDDDNPGRNRRNVFGRGRGGRRGVGGRGGRPSRRLNLEAIRNQQQGSSRANGFNRSGTTTIIGGNGGGAALLLASKYGKDVILVGQIKSSGCRRRPSSEAKFIEQRRKLSSNISVNKEGNNNSKNLFQKLNRLADSTTYVGDAAPISGPIDFQKRLQNLKIKRTEEINDENKIEKSEEFKTEKNEISPKEHLKSLAVEEKEFIMHRVEQESIITDGGLDHQNTEWDTLSNTTLSADCCSQIGGRIGLQQQLHDGDVSEASFVLVKRKLKIAWEHHQIRQIRKQSLLRKERITENNCCDMLQTPQQIKNIDRRLSNNWIPEITKLNDEN